MEKQTNSALKSLSKASTILGCFSPSKLHLGVSDISKKTGLPLSTTHRILTALVENGFLERNNHSVKYNVGPRLYVLGRLYLNSTLLVEAAGPVVKELNEVTHEGTSLEIFSRENTIVILEEVAPLIDKWPAQIGLTAPAYATSSGKALLSELTEEEIDALYPNEDLNQLTFKTIRTKTELKIELEQIRKSGVAYNNEQTLLGYIAIGSAIRDASGKVLAALTIGTPTHSLTEEKRQRLVTILQMGSSLASYRLGYQGMGHKVHELKELRLWWEGKHDLRSKYDYQVFPTQSIQTVV